MAGDDEFPPPILEYQTTPRGRNKEDVAKRVTGALASIAFAVIAAGAVIDSSGYYRLLGDDPALHRGDDRVCSDGLLPPGRNGADSVVAQASNDPGARQFERTTPSAVREGDGVRQ